MSSLKRFVTCFIEAAVVFLVMLSSNYTTRELEWLLSALSDAMFVLLGGMLGTVSRIFITKESNTKVVSKLVTASAIIVFIGINYILISIKGLTWESTLNYTIMSTILFSITFYIEITNTIHKLLSEDK